MKYFWLLIILFLSACDSNKNKTGIQKNQYNVIKEIPKDKKGRFHFYYRISRDIANQLKLDSLENGYDSLQIRIWYDYFRRGDERHLVVLKNYHGNWTCIIYYLKVGESNFSLTKQPVNTYRAIEKTPKSGWNNFISKLMALKILSLPDMEAINGFDDAFADGDRYSFEISTKEKYRFYSYWSPGFIKDKYTEANYVYQILKLLNEEFDFNGFKED